MRKPVLPENFRCPQQDELFAFLDGIYDRGPLIGAVTAPPGIGKSHAFRQYQAVVKGRYRERQEQRRTIAFTEVRARFRSEGCLATSEDRRWIQERWIAIGRRELVSESELLGMLQSRLCELGRPNDAEEVKWNSARPCPNVVIVTPSQTTTEVEMIKLMALGVTGRQFNYPGAFDPRQALLARLLNGNGEYLIIVDEAQRLKPAPLNLVREAFDDGGATVVVAGTPDLEANLARRGLESLFSRVGLHFHMEELTVEQVQKLLPGWDPAVQRRIYAYSGGVFRRIENLVRLCLQIADVNEEPKVTMEILNESVRHIPDLLPGDIMAKAPRPATARAELARPARAPVPETVGTAVAKSSTG